jgi:hypothetical protein
MRWIAGVMLLALGGGACGSKATTSAGQLHRCAPDGAAWVSPAAPDAGAGTAAAKLSCPGAISDYCANYAVACPPSTWAEAIAQQNTTGNPPQLTICDAYNWASVGWACGQGLNGVVFAYDKTTGKLLAAVELSTPGAPDQQICLAGPATVSPLGACTDYYDCFPNDAGLSRGRCYGDGGVDGSGGGG